MCMKQEFLPIGSVVLLEGGTKKIMITGYFAVAGENKKVWDYRGCPFPEGVILSSGVALFNHRQIKEVCHIGFKNDEMIDFLDKLEIIKEKE